MSACELLFLWTSTIKLEVGVSNTKWTSSSQRVAIIKLKNWHWTTITHSLLCGQRNIWILIKIIFYFVFSSILQIPGESTLKRNFQLLQREGHQAKPSAPPQQSHNQQHRGQRQPQQGHQRDNHRDHGGNRPPSSHQGWPVSSHFQAQPVQPQQHNKVPRQSQIIGKTSTFTTYILYYEERIIIGRLIR